MGLEANFASLNTQEQHLKDALQALCLTVREDLPAGGEAALADDFGDTAEDLLGWLQEALTACTLGERAAASSPPDLDGARRALVTCQDRHNHIARRFASELTSYDRLRLLARLGRDRGGEWRPWATSVRTALDRCRGPLDDIGQTLFACWRALTEQTAGGGVNVQATNIGQQILLPEEQRGMPPATRGYPG
jgi:hypothetical protein